jgi:hypothetical protein
MKIDYVLTGDFQELATVMIPVMKESRFLSDKPNVKSFCWYPISEETQCVEMEMTQKPTDEELQFLIREYQSLSIGVFEKEALKRVISIEEILEV